MSIYSNKREVEIIGEIGDVLTDLSMIVYSLKEAEIPEKLIKVAIETGFEAYKKEKSKKDADDRVSSILRKLGLEG